MKVNPLELANFSKENLKDYKIWGPVFKALQENKFLHRLIYPAKKSLQIDGKRR